MNIYFGLAAGSYSVQQTDILFSETLENRLIGLSLCRVQRIDIRCLQHAFIQTPYFLPTEGLNSLLQTAALGGIDVQLMLPERSDSRIIDKAVHSFIDDMLRAGVKVYFYTKGFLHAKMLIVDDLLTVVGSANMDFRSFEHNFEINAFVYGQDFNTAMRRVFDEDLRSCRRLIPSEWLRRPLPQRLSESFMRLFSPLL